MAGQHINLLQFGDVRHEDRHGPVVTGQAHHLVTAGVTDGDGVHEPSRRAGIGGKSINMLRPDRLGDGAGGGGLVEACGQRHAQRTRVVNGERFGKFRQALGQRGFHSLTQTTHRVNAPLNTGFAG
jgi:hypothetical protein